MPGEKSATDLVVEFWASQLMPAHADKREAFCAALRARLTKAIAEAGDRCVYLAVDYDPQGELLAALHDAGIACSGHMHSADGVFVATCRKTHTKSRNGAAFVKRGYGADETPLPEMGHGPRSYAQAIGVEPGELLPVRPMPGGRRDR
jgi:hypothetical protein